MDYKSKRWKALSAKAMHRDGYKCQIAARYGRSEVAEVVHHIYPVDEYPEYAYCLWNLISLSRAAHNKLHVSGESHPQAKYSAELVSTIKSRHANGERVCDLSREYGIPYRYVSGILNGRKRVHG